MGEGATRISTARLLTLEVVEALIDGLRLLRDNWRLGVIELVPALWLSAVMSSAVSNIRRWESGTFVRGERLLDEGLSRADILLVLSLAAVGAFVYLCNTVFAVAAADPEGPGVKRAVASLRARPDAVRRAIAWGAFAGLLRIADLLVPLPSTRLAVLVEVTGGMVVQQLLFTSVPARIAGLVGKGLNHRQSLILWVFTITMGFVAILPAFFVGRLAAEALGSDWAKPLGAVLFIAALGLQVASVVVVKAVALAAKLVTREAP